MTALTLIMLLDSSSAMEIKSSKYNYGEREREREDGTWGCVRNCSENFAVLVKSRPLCTCCRGEQDKNRLRRRLKKKKKGQQNNWLKRSDDVAAQLLGPPKYMSIPFLFSFYFYVFLRMRMLRWCKMLNYKIDEWFCFIVHIYDEPAFKSLPTLYAFLPYKKFQNIHGVNNYISISYHKIFNLFIM